MNFDWPPQENKEKNISNSPSMENKDSKKEGVGFVFRQNPELASVGTEEQYALYIETIFPQSKVQNILYHGTKNKFERFEKEYLGTNTGSPSAFNGFFFASSPETSLSYIGRQETIYAPEFLKYCNQYSIQQEENDARQKEIEKEMNELWERRQNLLRKIIDSAKGIPTKQLYESKVAELRKLHEEGKDIWEKNFMLDKTLGGYAKLTDRKVEELYETYLIAEENTHCLGVVLDIKNPGIHDDENQGYRKETYNNRTLEDRTDGRDGTIIQNTKDFGTRTYRPALFGSKEIKEDTDVYVVFEPEQIHILGSKEDQEKFREFVENKK